MPPGEPITNEANTLRTEVNLLVSWLASEDLIQVREIILLVGILDPVDLIKPPAVVDQIALQKASKHLNAVLAPEKTKAMILMPFGLVNSLMSIVVENLDGP